MFKTLSSVFTLLFVWQLSAQFNVNNVYSYHHIGLFEQNENAFQMALGGVRYGLIDSAYANGSNVALLPYHSKGQPIFGFDVVGRFSFFDSQTASVNRRVAYLRSINFSIPFAKRFGLGFGYRPVFSKGYRFDEFQSISGDSLRKIYQGSGNVQQAYLSFAFAPMKTSKTFLSFGAETSFNFGSPTDVRAIELVSFSFDNAANISSDTIRGFSYRLSTALKHEISKNYTISFGASYMLSSQWRTIYTDRIVGYGGKYGINHQVTQVLNNTQRSGTIQTPSMFGAGIGLEFRPGGFSLNTKRQTLIRIQGDFEQIQWADFGRTLEDIEDTSFNYTNTKSYRFGFELTPHRIANDRSPGLKYMGKVSYRLGLNLSQIALPNQHLNDRGITFGLGFPIPFDNSQSSINVGIRAGSVGDVGINAIRENYLAYQIGIVITSSNWERWFRKMKYD
jgi:hypothetical protein